MSNYNEPIRCDTFSDEKRSCFNGYKARSSFYQNDQSIPEKEEDEKEYEFINNEEACENTIQEDSQLDDQFKKKLMEDFKEF